MDRLHRQVNRAGYKADHSFLTFCIPSFADAEESTTKDARFDKPAHRYNSGVRILDTSLWNQDTLLMITEAMQAMTATLGATRDRPEAVKVVRRLNPRIDLAARIRRRTLRPNTIARRPIAARRRVTKDFNGLGDPQLWTPRNSARFPILSDECPWTQVQILTG